MSTTPRVDGWGVDHPKIVDNPSRKRQGILGIATLISLLSL